MPRSHDRGPAALPVIGPAALLVRAHRLGAVRERLLAWWDAGHRDLPWRVPRGEEADAYRVLVSEVMLQQTRVSVVVPYYLRWLDRFPTLESLALADEEDVLALWSGLGYYARARRLHDAAKEAWARHGGLPRSVEALSELPGLGPYTAGAVASIGFGISAPCVDGNVARVLSRLFLVEGESSRPPVRRTLWALAARLVRLEAAARGDRPASGAPARPGDLNQAVMELGATVCTPVPACSRCPVARLCRARGEGREREVPPVRRRGPRPVLRLACAVLRAGDDVLLVRRPPGGLFAGMWGLPSAVVGEGEDALLALRGEVLRRFGLRLRPRRELAIVERELTHRHLRLEGWDCPSSRGVLRRILQASDAERRGTEACDASEQLRSASRRALDEVALPTAMRLVLAQVAAGESTAAGASSGGCSLGRTARLG